MIDPKSGQQVRALLRRWARGVFGKVGDGLVDQLPRGRSAPGSTSRYRQCRWKLVRRFAPRKAGARSPLPPQAASAAHERTDLGAGTQCGGVATLNGVDAVLGCVAEPFDPGLVFALTLLQQAQALTDDFAGIAELA
jgi:hypothetical protein